jgi:hypothetical protein
MTRLPCFVVVVVVAGAAAGCASAPAAWSPAAREADGRSYGDGAVATEASAPAGMDFGGGVADFFGGADQTKSMEAPPSPPPPPKAAPMPAASPDEQAPKPVEAAKRLVIYTGTMALMVPAADVALAAFVDEVNAKGGYLQSRSATTVTVRIPAAEFFPVLEGLRKTGTVTDEQVNAQDVTKRVFDIELRLSTAEESRKRLVEILKAATKIEDILRIETELRRLTDEIEGMKGELRNLGDQVAFSTLTVSFYANAPAPRPYPDRTRSRFDWINQIGVEQVMFGF